MKNEQFSVGIFDSGVGGLTVVKEVMRQLPKETIYYFGDTLRCPYGNRPIEEVQTFTHQMVDFLMQFPLKAILIACNTVTAAALDQVKQKLEIPVIGVIEPGVRAAIKVTQNKKVGIIGTQGTIQSQAYEKGLLQIDPKMKVYSLACPPFVPLVEKGLYHTQEAASVVSEVLQPLKGADMDTLILGCTHYPLLDPFISQVMGEKVSTISSAEETAVELSTILHHQHLLAESRWQEHRFFTTGSVPLFRKIAKEWLGQEVQVEKVTLQSFK